MENFLKISAVFKELLDELSTLKTDLENDINYSVSHAEIVTLVEGVEDSVHEIETQVKDIEHDVDILNDEIEARQYKDNDEDDDDDGEKGYSAYSDDGDE
jgi:peptidoglycan hydrolase CwlO-like protein